MSQITLMLFELQESFISDKIFIQRTQLEKTGSIVYVVIPLEKQRN